MAINRDKILKSAEKLVHKGKIEQAIKEYMKLLKANPSDANTINRIGDLYGKIGKIDEAIEHYEKIADTFTQDGFATKAIAILKKINRLAPHRLDIFERLAELYLGQGLMVEANNQYQVMADWYVKNDDPENAIKILKKLVELGEDNHMAHLRLADLLMETGKADEAIEVYDRLGRLLLDRNKLDEAEKLYKHALSKKITNGGFVAPLCAALLDAGRSAAARDFLDEAIKVSPKHQDLQLIDVRVCLAFGNVDLAKQKADMILTARPDDNEVREIVGEAMITAGQGVEARDMLLPVAEQRLTNGDFPGAQEILQGLVKAMPQDQAVLKLAVRAYEPTGDKEMAFTLKAALADSHFRAGQHDDARTLYRELLTNEPDNAMFKQRMAQLDGVVEDDAAVDEDDADFGDVVIDEEPEFEPAPEPEPEPVAAVPEPEPEPEPAAAFDPDERFAEANVFAKYGLVEKALKHYLEIVEHFPDHAEAREKLVDLYIEQGNSAEAERIAAPLLAVYSENGDADRLEALNERLPNLANAGAEPAAAPAPAATAEPVPLPPPVVGDDDSDVIEVDIDGDDLDSVEFEAFDEPAAVEQVEVDAGEEVTFDEWGADEPTETPAGEEPVIVEEAAPEAVPEPEPEPEPAPEPEPEPEPAPAPVVEPEPQPTPPVQEERAKEPSTVSGGALSELDALEKMVLDTPMPKKMAEVAAEIESVVDKAPEIESVVDEAPEIESAADEVVEEPVAEEAVAETPSEEPVAEVPQEEMVEISDTLGGPPVADLEQLDFYIQQELFEDATRTLRELEAEYPDDSELGQRRLLLKSKGVLLEDVTAVEDGPEDLFGEEDAGFFDLAKELEEELAEEEAMVEDATGATEDEADLEEVFKEFQKGVSEQLSEEDADTHFNLGIAYKEMGLLAEAIREFQIASRDESYFVECCSMIGVCYVDQGMYEQAAEWYGKATTAPNLDDTAIMALRYELAAALESAGDQNRAVEIFKEIETASPGFRDVTERLVFLAGGPL